MINFIKQLKKRINNSDYFFISIIPILYIILLAFTAFFAHPNPEDIQKATIYNKCGILNTLTEQYLITDGRYMTNILHAFIPPVWTSPSNQYISALFFLSVFILSSIYFFKAFRKFFNLQKGKQIFIFAILFTSTYTIVIPELKYFMYLSPGGIVYGLSASIFLLFMGTLFHIISETNKNKKLGFLLLAIALEIISIGLNEMNMIISNLICFSCFLISFFYRKKNNLLIETAILLLISLSFSIYSISMPGIGFNRDVNFNSLISFNTIALSLFHSFKQSIYLIYLWITNTPLIFLLPFTLYIYEKQTISLKTIIVSPILFLLISTLILTFTNAAFILPFNDSTTFYNFPTRIQNTAQLFTLMTSIIVVFIVDFIPIRNKTIELNLHVSHAFRSKFIPLLYALLFLFHSTPINLINDWTSGRILSYNRKMNDRYRAIYYSKLTKQPFVYLETIKELPYSITDDVKLSPNAEELGWVRWYEKYFDIKIKMEK